MKKIGFTIFFILIVFNVCMAEGQNGLGRIILIILGVNLVFYTFVISGLIMIGRYFLGFKNSKKTSLIVCLLSFCIVIIFLVIDHVYSLHFFI
jgi:hypothetical protein